MSALLLFSAPYTPGTELARRVAELRGWRLTGDRELIAAAAATGAITPASLERVMRGGTSLLDTLNHERRRAVASLRHGLAELLTEDGVVHHGPGALLAPRSLAFGLSVALVAPRSDRLRRCREERGMDPHDAEREVERLDEEQARWCSYLFNRPPWDPELYDVVLPTHGRTLEELLRVVEENLAKPVLARTPASEETLHDFKLAARVQTRLAQDGHDVWVEAEQGYVTVLINSYAIRMGALERELQRLAGSVQGVKGVVTRVGPRFRQPGISFDLHTTDTPRALLVDDEREFVQTLAERLRTRDLESSVAYGGAEALALMAREQPEVVVLDLQMPGIDGIEVLRRVRKGHPDTKVIILTGHGSERERRLALELGAFAYLSKPVDIEILALTMREAYDQIQRACQRPGVPR